ncbi:DUF1304 domain-containing protein [Shewanella sp. 202IG2-18]|uniref:DUF1304 domain-containing protein n=1 Tax=Parashewanella hymeniacidonis TaxID=2807618 RepID=UPI00195FB275|nr:DUF1304 domain-containing protein [Parashewanella hymeniacidonis]MBM7074093.1 DUF1304 domain-containing protein [Parashewanella hymeniacidonis]
MGIQFVLVLLVAIEHAYILVLEKFLWTRHRTLRVFGITKEEDENTKVMAANQGLYNGFLSAGIFWGLIHPQPDIGLQVQIFFLCCVITAAVYGSITFKKSILLVQGLPAALALIAVLA